MSLTSALICAGGSKKRRILWYLREQTGKVLFPKDVQNLVAKMRKETYTSPDENVRVAELLGDFSEGVDNAVESYKSSTGSTSCITFQTAHMRRMARLFPEVVCVDSTFGTNKNR